jgi:enoyl-CoA hydratase/carnithine racemase
MSRVTELVHLSTSDEVATITLDSPANRNALSAQLVSELLQHLHTADADPAVRVIVVTATGSTFCSGADLAEAVGVGMERATRSLLSLLRTVVELHTPVVAVVCGHVRAGGVGLVAACDLALAARTSTFAFTEARLGLTPAIISLTTRSRMTEREAARKYLTCAVFDGIEAARVGLVTEAADEESIDARLAELLAQLRSIPAQGLTETKRLLAAPMRAAMDADGDAMVELSARLFSSDVAQKAMAAFRELRGPRRTEAPDRGD